MKPIKIDKEIAKQEIIEALKTSRNAICFFFNGDGTSKLITATEDEEYDNLAFAIVRSLEFLSKKMQEK